MAQIGRSGLTDYIPADPCVQCFNGQELDALIVLLLADKAGYTLPADLHTLIDNTVCIKCYSETQMKQGLAGFLWEQNANGETANELMAKMKCLQCVDPQVIKALTVYLLVLGLTPLAPT